MTVELEVPSATSASSATMTSGSARTARRRGSTHIVDDAAEIAGEQAERRAEQRAEQGRQRRDGQDVARADDDAREDVAAELVGAEPVVGRGRRQRVERDRRHSGSYGRPVLPKSAQTTQNSRMTTPTRKVRERSSETQPLAPRGCAGACRPRRSRRSATALIRVGPEPDARIEQRNRGGRRSVSPTA